MLPIDFIKRSISSLSHPFHRASSTSPKCDDFLLRNHEFKSQVFYIPLDPDTELGCEMPTDVTDARVESIEWRAPKGSGVQFITIHLVDGKSGCKSVMAVERTANRVGKEFLVPGGGETYLFSHLHTLLNHPHSSDYYMKRLGFNYRLYLFPCGTFKSIKKFMGSSHLIRTLRLTPSHHFTALDVAALVHTYALRCGQFNDSPTLIPHSRQFCGPLFEILKEFAEKNDGSVVDIPEACPEWQEYVKRVVVMQNDVDDVLHDSEWRKKVTSGLLEKRKEGAIETSLPRRAEYSRAGLVY